LGYFWVNGWTGYGSGARRAVQQEESIMGNCMFNCLKYTFGFWGAILILGLLVAAIATAIATTGGSAVVGLAGLVEAALGSAAAAAGLKIAAAGAAGLLVSLIGCLVACLSLSP
jgi:hypothetical protein